MYFFKTNIRVTYADTDKMGYSYYGNYPTYYEVGRTELIRSLGLSYKFFEENDIMMPVIGMNVKYIKPAVYDDLLTINTIIKELPYSRIKFYYEIFNQENELINIGETELVFVSKETRKITKSPDFLNNILKPYF